MDAATVLTFFCKDAAGSEKAPMIIESFVYRLLDADERLFQHVPASHKRSKRSDPPLSFEALWEIYRAILQDPSIGRTFFIIDGLDECEPSFVEKFLHQLNQTFGNIADNDVKSAGLAKVILTCRPSGVIPRFIHAHSFHSIDIWEDGAADGNAKHLRQDMKTVVEQEMNQIAQSRNVTPELKEYAMGKVLFMAQGMFLYVDKALEKIRTVSVEGDQDAIENLLQSLPADMDEYYADVLHSISPKSVEVARQILMMLLFASRPMTAIELAEALAIGPGRASMAQLKRFINRDIVNWIQSKCGQVIKLNDGVLELVHHSLREYLLALPSVQNLKPAVSHFRYDPAFSHLELALLCIRYLQMSDFNHPFRYAEEKYLNSGGGEFSFHRYAVFSWPRHLQMAGSAVDKAIPTLSSFLTLGSTHYVHWTQLYRFMKDDLPLTEQPSPVLHTLSEAGLSNLFPYMDIGRKSSTIWHSKAFATHLFEELIKAFNKSVLHAKTLNVTAEVDEEDERGLTALDHAALGGHAATVSDLLKAGAAPNGAYVLCWTPLQLAALRGHAEVVLELLRAKAIIVDTFNTQNRIRTALHNASAAGHINVIAALLEHGASLNMQDAGDETPLLLAVGNGHAACVALLLASGANVEAVSDLGWRPLQSAANEGYALITQHLLRYRAKLNVRDISGFVPLHYAAQSGHKEVVQHLLDAGADVNLTVLVNGPASAEPMYVGDDRIFPWRSMEEFELMGWTALHLAANEGHDSTVQVLLKAYPNFMIRTEDGATALSLAAADGHESVVATLIKAGASIEDCLNTGASPLYSACSGGHTGVVKLLLEKGAQTESGIYASDIMPLHVAGWENHVDIVGLLLEYGADTKIKTRIPKGWAPLVPPSVKGCLDVIKLLLKKGADPNAEDELQKTPLDGAAQEGHEAAVEILMQRGAMIKKSPEPRWTALHQAALTGQNRSVAAISDATPEVIDYLDEDGRSALWLALAKGHVDVVDCLIKKGANVRSTDETGLTTLHAAALGKNKDLVCRMLEVYDVEVRSKQRERPLHMACSVENLEVIKLFLEKGADPHTGSETGWTPLHLAASSGSVGAINILLGQGVTVDAVTSNGDTALNCGTQEGHVDAVKALIAAGAKIRRSPGSRIPPLLIAAGRGRDALIPILTKAGAELDDLSRNRFTPLLEALCSIQLPTAQQLVLHGADIDPVNCYARNAFDFASIECSRTGHDPTVFCSLRSPFRRKVLVSSICRMTLEIQKDFRMDNYRFYSFGICLQLIDNDVDAQLAFERLIKIEKDGTTIRHEVLCSLCKPQRNIIGPRYKCRWCVEIDLCQDCMTRYDKGEHLSRRVCYRHSFLKIPPDTPKYLAALEECPPDEETVSEWLAHLQARYTAMLSEHPLETLPSSSSQPLPMHVTNWLLRRIAMPYRWGVRVPAGGIRALDIGHGFKRSWYFTLGNTEAETSEIDSSEADSLEAEFFEAGAD